MGTGILSRQIARRKWRATHAEEERISSRRYYANNRAKVRLKQLKYQYGITEEEFTGLLNSQNNKCAICQLTFDFNTKWTTPHVDHDHKTSSSRGLLCGSCNLGIGYLKDNTENLQSAIKYLENYKCQLV